LLGVGDDDVVVGIAEEPVGVGVAEEAPGDHGRAVASERAAAAGRAGAAALNNAAVTVGAVNQRRMRALLDQEGVVFLVSYRRSPRRP
jgi:hypothetical protein